MADIQVRSSDDKIFEVELKVAKMFGAIWKLVSEKKDEDEVIPLPNINGEVLYLVLEWGDQHRKEKPTTEDDRNFDELSQWDQQFLKEIDKKSLMYDMIKAVTELHNERLLNLLFINVATVIRKKSIEDVRVYLGVKEDEEDDDD